MTFNFFATSDEIYEIWNDIANRPGVRLVEADSRPGKQNREFDKFPLTELQAQDRNFSVVAWPSKAGGQPRLRTITFNAATAKALGASGRSSLTSPAFVSIYRTSAPDVGLIAPSELIYWTEKLATKKGQFDADQIREIDWNELGREVIAIKRWIIKQSVARWRGAPVSRKVADILSGGKAQLWLWGATGRV